MPDEARERFDFPTALLLKPDQTFHSFGYEAMNYYYKRLSEYDKRRFYYFENFKLTEKVRYITAKRY